MVNKTGIVGETVRKLDIGRTYKVRRVVKRIFEELKEALVGEESVVYLHTDRQNVVITANILIVVTIRQVMRRLEGVGNETLVCVAVINKVSLDSCSE